MVNKNGVAKVTVLRVTFTWGLIKDRGDDLIK